MVDKGGEWTFGRWYDAEPTAVKTFKGWETCGNVAEMTVSARRRRQSHGGGNSVGGGGSARGKLRALRSEQVNLNHCFRGTASAATTATATLQPPCQSGGSVPGVLARGESTFASRHFSQLRLQRLQAAANELDRLDALAESMSLAKDHVRPAGVRGGDLRMSPVKRRRKLKRYLPFDKPERAETRSERALERAVDARQTLSTAAADAADAPAASTSAHASSPKSSTAHLFASMAENFVSEQSCLAQHKRQRNKNKKQEKGTLADGERKIGTASASTTTPTSHNFVPSAGPLTTLFSAEVVSRIHGFLAEQQIVPLMKATGYSRYQLYGHFMRFKALCMLSKSPEGVDRKAFGSGVPSLSVEDSLFVDRIFNVVDTERRGLLDWPHYIKAMSALEQGTPEARTTFLFHIYDTGGDDGISREELRHFFVSSLMTKADSFVEDVADIFVEGVFSRVNVNEKGDLTLPEALRYIENTDDVVDLHGMFGRSMAMQGFETVVDGKERAGQETKKQKEARRIRKLRRAAGNNLSLNVVTSAKVASAPARDSSYLATAIDQIRSSSAGEGISGLGANQNEDKDEAQDAKYSDLAKMHLQIARASHMSPKARRRRASVVFLPSKSDGGTPQIELKPLGQYHSKGRKGSYMMT